MMTSEGVRGALHQAAAMGDIEKVRELLSFLDEKRSNLDLRNSADGFSPLLESVFNNQPAMCEEFLVRYNANWMAVDFLGSSALHLIAISSSNFRNDCMNKIFAHISAVPNLGEEKRTMDERKEQIRIFVNSFNYDGFSALHLAVLNSKEWMIEDLLGFHIDEGGDEKDFFVNVNLGCRKSWQQTLEDVDAAICSAE